MVYAKANASSDTRQSDKMQSYSESLRPAIRFRSLNKSSDIHCLHLSLGKTSWQPKHSLLTSLSWFGRFRITSLAFPWALSSKTSSFMPLWDDEYGRSDTAVRELTVEVYPCIPLIRVCFEYLADPGEQLCWSWSRAERLYELTLLLRTGLRSDAL